MNPHARASHRIKNADSQRRRRLDPDYRTQEQSSDRGQRLVKRGDQARREEEQATNTSRRQTARLDLARREDDRFHSRVQDMEGSIQTSSRKGWHCTHGRRTKKKFMCDGVPKLFTSRQV